MKTANFSCKIRLSAGWIGRNVLKSKRYHSQGVTSAWNSPKVLIHSENVKENNSQKFSRNCTKETSL